MQKQKEQSKDVRCVRAGSGGVELQVREARRR